jgi:hypothetical protein
LNFQKRNENNRAIYPNPSLPLSGLCGKTKAAVSVTIQSGGRSIWKGTGIEVGADVTMNRDQVGRKPQLKLHLLITGNELFGESNHRVKAIEILPTCFSNLPR